MNVSDKMSNKMPVEDFAVPAPDEVQDLQESASQLQEDVEHYRAEAQWIDDRYKAQNEDRRISLDDLPFGEELIRIRTLPQMLRRAELLLNQIAENKLSPKNASEAFEEANELVDDVQSTLDDFTPLPKEE